MTIKQSIMKLIIKQNEDLLKEAQEALQFRQNMTDEEADYWIKQEVNAKFQLKRLSNFKYK
jgi:hypothetical protein